MNYSLNQKFKALDKLFSAGFVDEKSILNMKLEDLLKMPNLSTIEVNIIIEFKKAIKDKNIVTFLSNQEK
jgi:hypothetical protein